MLSDRDAGDLLVADVSSRFEMTRAGIKMPCFGTCAPILFFFAPGAEPSWTFFCKFAEPDWVSRVTGALHQSGWGDINTGGG
jgi:hypothetical protein